MISFIMLGEDSFYYNNQLSMNDYHWFLTKNVYLFFIGGRDTLIDLKYK